MSQVNAESTVDVDLVGGITREALAMSTGHRFEVFQGSLHRVPIRLRLQGTRVAWDVSQAEWFKLDARRHDGYRLPTRTWTAAQTGEDWATGLVRPVFDTDGGITERPGTYEFWLSVRIASEEIVVLSGVVEVEDRSDQPDGFRIAGGIAATASMDGDFPVVVAP